MGKTRAEIQKNYRERKKLEDKSFANKERERKRSSYVKTCDLTASAAKKRREEVKERVRQHREKKKTINTKSAENSGSSSGITRRSQKKTPCLQVKIDFPKPSREKKMISVRKRVSRSISKAHRKINNLESEKIDLKKRVWKLEKRLQRQKTAAQKIGTAGEASSTPKTKTNEELIRAGLEPKRVPLSIRKKLLFANAIADNVNDVVHSKSSNKSKRASAVSIASGKVLRKYRLLASVKKNTGISSRGLYRGGHRAEPKKRLLNKRRQLQEKVIDFLTREDNSRVMPGKADFKVLENRQKMQKRYLNDYLGNLHEKFCAENPNTKISKSWFCKFRPSYILPTSFTSRSTCLCHRHQNMALKLRALRSQGVRVASISPDVFIKSVNNAEDIDAVLQQCESTVKYSEWKRVTDEKTGKKPIRIVENEVNKADFQSTFTKEVNDFRAHAERVRTQYGQVKKLKNELPEGHVLVQMDFAENYTCQSMEEVQSAYWSDAKMVTLHPVVVYFKENDQLAHKSMVYVSDELSHKAATVYAFLKVLVPTIKSFCPTLNFVHYITDSPTSQYRNRHIFQIVSQHIKEFGIPASWHYFEAGHGKGPCDGIGGTAKRLADEAVRQQKIVIQDAKGFFDWTQQALEKGSIKYVYVTKDQCSDAQTDLTSFGDLLPVPGTMKLHAVVGVSDGKIMVRETSCFCSECFADGVFKTESSSCNWRCHQLKLELPGVVSRLPTPGDWVTAMYSHKWYVGKVVEVDNKDRDAKISFMKTTSASPITFQWPSIPDVIWVDESDIICVIEEPLPRGRSRRQFTLNDETVSMIGELFLKHSRI